MPVSERSRGFYSMYSIAMNYFNYSEARDKV